MDNEKRIIELLEKILFRLDSLEARMDSLEARMDSLEHRMDSLEARMDSLEAHQVQTDERLDSLEHRMDRGEALLLSILKRVEQNSREIRRVGLILENDTNKKITALFDGRDFCLLHQKEFQHTAEVVEDHEIRIFSLEHRR